MTFEYILMDVSVFLLGKKCLYLL